ncbi:hypothetical protein TNCV_3235571 [Trichonephila clavipes]|nr:hypothetical protein TNCV_3235571 [Trichonephila clavipes]
MYRNLVTSQYILDFKKRPIEVYLQVDDHVHPGNRPAAVSSEKKQDLLHMEFYHHLPSWAMNEQMLYFSSFSDEWSRDLKSVQVQKQRSCRGGRGKKELLEVITTERLETEQQQKLEQQEQLSIEKLRLEMKLSRIANQSTTQNNGQTSRFNYLDEIVKMVRLLTVKVLMGGRLSIRITTVICISALLLFTSRGISGRASHPTEKGDAFPTPGRRQCTHKYIMIWDFPAFWGSHGPREDIPPLTSDQSEKLIVFRKRILSRIQGKPPRNISACTTNLVTNLNITHPDEARLPRLPDSIDQPITAMPQSRM